MAGHFNLAGAEAGGYVYRAGYTWGGEKMGADTVLGLEIKEKVFVVAGLCACRLERASPYASHPVKMLDV